MGHGPEHHVEHAEHASHAAHDPFDRQVTMTIAIIAAFLALVGMLSHRAHNETLRLATEATRYQAEASIEHNGATNAWGYYQAWSIREHAYRTALEQAKLFAKDAKALEKNSQGKTALEAATSRWQQQYDKYTHPQTGLTALESRAKGHENRAAELQQKARESLKKSDKMHHIGDTYDFGHLGVELGLILCSIAVLTKRRGFWYAGMLAALVGLGLAGFGLFEQYVH
jgi:hypothetical protein